MFAVCEKSNTNYEKYYSISLKVYLWSFTIWGTRIHILQNIALSDLSFVGIISHFYSAYINIKKILQGEMKYFNNILWQISGWIWPYNEHNLLCFDTNIFPLGTTLLKKTRLSLPLHINNKKIWNEKYVVLAFIKINISSFVSSFIT